MTVPWTDRVVFSQTGGAYRPRQLLIHRDDVSRAQGILGRLYSERVRPADEESIGRYVRYISDAPVLEVVDELRSALVRAQPNHVLFADSGLTGNPFSGNPFSGNPFSGNPFSGNPFSGNPFSGNPFSGNPFSGNPFSGNPFSGNPFSGNPFSGNPFSGNPYSGVAYGTPDLLRDRAFATTGQGPSLARPAARLPESGPRPTAGGWPAVTVLDVGLPDPHVTPNYLPYLLQECGSSGVLGPGVPDEDGDRFLDRIAGHGMFVAGRVAQADPQCSLDVVSVVHNAGDADEKQVADALTRLANGGQALADVVNLSFGGYEIVDMGALADAVRELQQARGPIRDRISGSGEDEGVVVVASAGNDACSRAPYPAGLRDVVSVGAIGPFGPAYFTNYGLWVRACAAGVDVTSTFFQGYNGREHTTPTGDVDAFDGAATWSGTSFAAPFVAGKISRLVRERGILPKQAVALLLDAPGLARIPGLGTIVTD